MADGAGEVPPGGEPVADPTAGAAGGGALRKYVRYSEGLGQTICLRLAGGESLSAICRDEGMPHPTTVYAWTRDHPEFGAAFLTAQKEARVAERLADRAAAARRWGADGEADGAFGVLRDGRGRWSTFTPELGEEICWRLANGESLKSIGMDPRMPSSATVLYWARRYPAFGDAYAQARAMMADSLSDMALEVAMTTNPREVWADRLRVDTIRWLAARQAPRKYCERVQAAAELEAIRRENGDRDGEGEADDRRLTINVVNFRKGPNGEVLVAPPRCAAEEEAWERAYGTPYDGPR